MKLWIAFTAGIVAGMVAAFVYLVAVVIPELEA